MIDKRLIMMNIARVEADMKELMERKTKRIAKEKRIKPAPVLLDQRRRPRSPPLPRSHLQELVRALCTNTLASQET